MTETICTKKTMQALASYREDVKRLKETNSELLEALENIMECFDGDASLERMEEARAAIAKANQAQTAKGNGWISEQPTTVESALDIRLYKHCTETDPHDFGRGKHWTRGYMDCLEDIMNDYFPEIKSPSNAASKKGK